ncbi:nucleolin [Microdochium nivale]|nr:nucleolin [Microdochium nivale]
MALLHQSTLTDAPPASCFFGRHFSLLPICSCATRKKSSAPTGIVSRAQVSVVALTASSNMPAGDLSEATPYTRLHITPFDESLLNIVVPTAVRPRARNISYHTLETFPDKPYGFVELPTDDAERLKKKLNSAVLRGHKLCIEVARPVAAEASANSGKSCKVKAAVSSKSALKKRKREPGVLLGAEIQGRKIKRGWTTSEAEMIQKKRDRAGKAKDSKKENQDASATTKKSKKGEVKKSKYTEAPECLFKTRIPSKSEPVPTAEPRDDEQEPSTPPKKKKRRVERDVVMHEFEKSVKFPSFLKVNSSATSATEPTTFIDGKGWVDSKGEVVEGSQSTRPPTAGIIQAKAKRPKKQKPSVISRAVSDLDDNSSRSSSSDASSSSDESQEQATASRSKSTIQNDAADDTTSAEEDSSSDEEHSTSDDEKEAEEESTTYAGVAGPPAAVMLHKDHTVTSAAAKSDGGRPKSSGSVTSLTIKIPPATPGPVKVHPLEALYKRPQGDASTPNAQQSKPFSFFDNNDNDDDIEEGSSTTAQTLQVPMTPFTEQDFEFRVMRSAAPTPDTAHPNRTFAPWSTQDTVDEEEEKEAKGNENHDGDDSIMSDTGGLTIPTGLGGTRSAPISDFQKHFWENRGDINRKWRKRRKTAAKEKRYRDNRARADRAI